MKRFVGYIRLSTPVTPDQTQRVPKEPAPVAPSRTEEPSGPEPRST